jgi:hypothetical protein
MGARPGFNTSPRNPEVDLNDELERSLLSPETSTKATVRLSNNSPRRGASVHQHNGFIACSSVLSCDTCRGCRRRGRRRP